MKRIILIIIPIVLVIAAGLAIFGFLRARHEKEVALSEFLLCESQFKDGKYQESVKLLEAFVSKRGKSQKAPDANYYLAMSLEKLGEKSKALEIWNKIISKYPKSQGGPEAYYYVGLGHAESGNNDKAVESYTVIVNNFPESPMVAGALYGLGKIYESQDKKTEALENYQKVMDKYPNSEFTVDSERRWSQISFSKFIDENAITYEVQKGDSPVSIGAKFRIAPGLVKSLNNLTGNSLQVGQTLKLIQPNFNILVDLSKYKLYLKSGDKIVKIYTVATGKKATPTPTGEYKVTDKLINPTWFQTLPSGEKNIVPGGDPKNELGTRWIGFKPAYGIHGTIEPHLIGQAVSHGCVRMHNQDVEELYELVSQGTPVRIIGSSDKI